MARCPTLKTFLKLLAITYFGLTFYGILNFKSRVMFSMPDFMFEDSNFFMISKSNDTKHCRLRAADLGEVTLNLSSSLTLEDVHLANPEVEKGGKWRPKDCEPWQKVAIITPYRDRAFHLRLMLNRLHPMLQKQKLHYQIFVVVQAGEEPFNKGRLVNQGYLEALKREKFDCIIMQDVDMLPETDRNIYVCDQHARHLGAAIDEQRYHPMFYFQFGGVCALSTDNYNKINGFPNRYAGWGNEDDDVSARTIGADECYPRAVFPSQMHNYSQRALYRTIALSGLLFRIIGVLYAWLPAIQGPALLYIPLRHHEDMIESLLLTRPPYHIGRYKMIRHMKSGRAEHGYDHFLQWRYWWKIDGLSNMEATKCRTIEVTEEPMYTNITVDVGLPPDPPREDIPSESFIWFLWFFIP